MSRTTDRPSTRAPRQLWRPAGLLWLTVNLAALAVGFFPELIVVNGAGGPAKPSLQTLAVAQVSFLLLVYPLTLLRRSLPSAPALRLWTGEAALWLAMAAPFVAAGAYLADATVQDAVRAELLALSAFVAAWSLATLAGRCLCGQSLAALAGVMLVLAGPFAVYLCWEFGPPLGWLWQAVPVTFAWSVSQSRLGRWTPEPIWAWLLWPALGVALMLFNVVLPPRRPRS